MIPRFTRAERALHWATGLAVLTCAVTGFVLYVGWPPALIGRRTLLRDVHVVAGVLMPVPLVLAYLGRWRAAVRADVRRLARWTRADRRWLLSRGRDATGEVGKFNAGQKANAAFIAGMIPVMLATGVDHAVVRPAGRRHRLPHRRHVRPRLDGHRHLGGRVGHIVFALSDRMSLRGMVTGRVARFWAEDRHPAGRPELVTASDGGPDGGCRGRCR